MVELHNKTVPELIANEILSSYSNYDVDIIIKLLVDGRETNEDKQQDTFNWGDPNERSEGQERLVEGTQE